MVVSSSNPIISVAQNESIDEAERGLGSSTLQMTPPLPCLDHGQKNITNDKIHASSVEKPRPHTMKIGQWMRFRLWFNPYRMFFTFTVLINLVGIILAALHRFSYAEKHLGAMALGNLLCAILFRNELWMRLLYLVAIHGLRSVSRNPCIFETTNSNIISGHLHR